jgi:hypothetical protein
VAFVQFRRIELLERRFAKLAENFGGMLLHRFQELHLRI